MQNAKFKITIQTGVTQCHSEPRVRGAKNPVYTHWDPSDSKTSLRVCPEFIEGSLSKGVYRREFIEGMTSECVTTEIE